MVARLLIVFTAASILAVQVVRNAAVQSLAKMAPQTAARFWSGHPSVQVSRGLVDIAEATRERRAIPPATFLMIDEAALKAPLASEPFMVRGVQAQTVGNWRRATAAFAAAQRRNPRSLPAAYFLAEYYFRAGEPLRGLQQTMLLARISPGGVYAVVPFVAKYAQDRSHWGQMRALFRSEPWLAEGVLLALAHDANNADAVLALADGRHRRPDSPWLRTLISSLVAGAEYDRARSIWSSIGAARWRAESLIYDTEFADRTAPPPFNWSLSTAGIGLAERQPGGRLHLIFYGNQDGALASQLVLLPPGTYRLQFGVYGTPVHAETLRWSIRCDKAADPIALVGVDNASRRGWTFQVPGNCAAQWLELSGTSGDIAQQSEVTISGLRLTRARPGA